jgi:RNA recognition motif-containing protein
MTKKIYVGNLPFRTTEDDLAGLFQQAGTVEAVSIITDRETGRSKGFGFVTMNDDEAEKAIAQFNGADFNGRALTVNEARPMVKKEFTGRAGRSDRY